MHGPAFVFAYSGLSPLMPEVCLSWPFVNRAVASAGIIVGGLPSAFPVAVAELLG